MMHLCVRLTVLEYAPNQTGPATTVPCFEWTGIDWQSLQCSFGVKENKAYTTDLVQEAALKQRH